MRVLLSAAILLFPAACSASTESGADQTNVIEPNAQLMDRIEESVDLPQGASALSHYARYYAKTKDGHIRAIYLSTFEEEGSKDSCSEPELSYPTLKSGQRIWLEDQQDLPFIFDGGCQLVEIIFDPETTSFESVRCNGEA